MKSVSFGSLGFFKLRTIDIAVLGILMALELIINRFMVATQFIQISFGFVIVAIASYLYGPVWSSMIAAITDILGTLISGSVYFPGFTLSAILGAVIYGLFFFNHKVTGQRIFLAQLIITLFVDVILNTLWLTMMYKTPFFGILPVRILKEVIVTPFQMLIIYLAFRTDAKQFASIKNRLSL